MRDERYAEITVPKSEPFAGKDWLSVNDIPMQHLGSRHSTYLATRAKVETNIEIKSSKTNQIIYHSINFNLFDYLMEKRKS